MKRICPLFLILIVNILLGFHVINTSNLTGTHFHSNNEAVFDTSKFVNDVHKLNLYTTNKENYKYSIFYSEAGEGFWSVEFFFDSLYNFKAYYVIDNHGGEEIVKFSVFQNDSMVYLVDSVDYGDVCLKRYSKSLMEFKGLEENISYEYGKSGKKIKEIKYRFLKKEEFIEEEKNILNDLHRYVRHVKNKKYDFFYEKQPEENFLGKYYYLDSLELSPYEMNITEIRVDSLLYKRILKNELKY